MLKRNSIMHLADRDNWPYTSAMFLTGPCVGRAPLRQCKYCRRHSLSFISTSNMFNLKIVSKVVWTHRIATVNLPSVGCPRYLFEHQDSYLIIVTWGGFYSLIYYHFELLASVWSIQQKTYLQWPSKLVAFCFDIIRYEILEWSYQ